MSINKNKRQIVFAVSRFLRRVFNFFSHEKKVHLLVDCPADFHFSHVSPVLAELSNDRNFTITVLQWEGFSESLIENIRYIDRDTFRREFFKTYDLYLTTHFGLIPWWFEDVYCIYFSHGIGPKVAYFNTEQLHCFDAILAPGPYIAEKKKEYLGDDSLIFHSGLPALDIFYSPGKFDLPVKSSFLDNKPVLLYAPSWSDDQDQISVDLMIVQELIDQNICNVIFRPHPLLFRPDRCGGVNWKAKLSALCHDRPNFIVYSGEGSSIYDILGGVDFLLSDISSVLYEFLILDKPVILYLKDGVASHYDCENYIELTKKSCHIINNAEEVRSVLTECLVSPNLLSEHRKDLLSVSLYNPGTATKETCTILKNISDSLNID